MRPVFVPFSPVDIRGIAQYLPNRCHNCRPPFPQNKQIRDDNLAPPLDLTVAGLLRSATLSELGSSAVQCHEPMPHNQPSLRPPTSHASLNYTPNKQLLTVSDSKILSRR